MKLLSTTVMLLACSTFLGCDRTDPTAPPALPTPDAAATPPATSTEVPQAPGVTVPVPVPGELKLHGTSLSPEAPAPAAEPESARSSEFFAPADREAFDLSQPVTAHDGQVMTLQDFVGHPMALTFMYTRCPMPDMCPMTIAAMRSLQRKVAALGIDEKVRMVLITMDPHHDTPKRLATYAKDHGLQTTNLTLVRPDPQEANALFHEFGLNLKWNEDMTISHPLDLHLIDSQGRSARWYTGAIWDTDLVAQDLQKLVEENAAAAVSPAAAEASPAPAAPTALATETSAP